jgi:hypothetical protein
MPVDISLAVEKKTRSPEDEREPAYLVTPGMSHSHRRDERMGVFFSFISERRHRPISLSRIKT